MIVNEIYSGIYQLPEFITVREQTMLLNTIKSHAEDDWITTSASVPSNWRGRVLAPKYNETMYDLMGSLNLRIRMLFKDYESSLELFGISRIPTSDIGLIPHTDTRHDTMVNCHYGLILYINDDYVGGEIFYPDIDFEHKPLARSLLVHEAHYYHGVKPVSIGTRYMMTAFFNGTPDRPVLLDDIFKESHETTTLYG